MLYQLKHQLGIRPLFILLTTLVVVTCAKEVENMPPEKSFESDLVLSRSGFYVLWTKLVVTATGDQRQSVVSKNFEVVKVPTREDIFSLSTERQRLLNIAAKAELENSLICAIFTFLKILLILDVLILIGVVFAIILGGFRNSEESATDQIVKV
ncbi:uncharacterized protein LOC129240681 [Anastrepha obliqua]|uniref:uncharacterized protein LOC129240681 n=1 Tax=Anastrepha obliqua TaxID=95512 RepID=UPI00240955D9|nr:uncharacterized protein LOC129240681 [Anastrepha obliqua]